MLAPADRRSRFVDKHMEGFVAWFLGQSWLIILLSVLLGLLIGWALWRRPWLKRYFSESEAITQVSREHSQALADKDSALAERDRAMATKDAEITRLRALLDKRSAEPAAATVTPAPATRPEQPRRRAGVGARSAAAASAPAAARRAETPADEPDEERAAVTEEMRVPVPTAESVDVQNIESPSVDVEAEAPSTGEIDLAGIQAASVDVSNDATAAAQVTGGAATATPLAGGDLTAEPGTDAERAESAGEAPAEDDDLERIEGIGPRIATALRSAGITTFRRLSESDVAALQSALEAAGLRFAPSLPTWSRQARLLADGDEDGFLKLTEQLVAGRDVGRRG